MKSFLTSTALLFFSFHAFADCELKNQLQGQKHFTCSTPESKKAIHVLDLKGGFAETAYYHGYFLKNEIETGVLPSVQEKAELALSELTPSERQQVEVIKTCILDSYRASVSEEFKKGLRELYRGYKTAGGKVAWKPFEEANYLVEFSIFADSMQRLLEKNPRQEKRHLFAECAPYFIGDALLKPFKTLAKGLQSIKMGCTGISASESFTSDRQLVHGRNFDTGLLGSYEKNQVLVINRQKNGITSVGVASAGLHYAGGISGFNSYGLAGSLHELQTEGTRVRYVSGSSDIAPYLLHFVLMNARTLDEAIKIIQARKGFGAWTFFISDSKTNETASIELSGDVVVVARRRKNQHMGQSNHFLAPATAKEGYEYSLNKTLETRARLNHVERKMSEDQGQIDAQWGINILSGHYDELMGRRSFGRTTTKVYTAATHVMIPGRQEVWMSLGSTYPTHRSGFIGLRLQTPDSQSPVRVLGFKRAAEDSDLGSWYDSMKYYVQAYLTIEKNPHSLDNLKQGQDFLNLARSLASESGIFEFPYEFMSARIGVLRAALELQNGHRRSALEILSQSQKHFSEIESSLSVKIHAYERFQLHLWQFRAESLKPLADQKRTSTYHNLAQSELQNLIQKYPTQKELRDLQLSLSQKSQLPVVLDADVRLGTVE